uniref:SFRICE_013132 n=1 Tax=Spodoptera frugiperda TaxID=7108 RepID=A0A2H1VIH6_SPOFR
MCVKIALCLALIVSIDGYVLKHRSVPLSPEGLILEVAVRDKNDPRHPISAMKIDINEKDKKVDMSSVELSTEGTNSGNVPRNVPTLEDRVSIIGGGCPQDTTSVGGFCFPTDDA